MVVRGHNVWCWIFEFIESPLWPDIWVVLKNGLYVPKKKRVLFTQINKVFMAFNFIMELTTKFTLLKYMHLWSLLYSQVCTHHHELRTFLLPLKKSVPIISCSLSPTLSLGQIWIYFKCLWVFLFRMFHVNVTIQYVVFYVWLLSLRMIFSRFIHAITLLIFLFIAK